LATGLKSTRFAPHTAPVLAVPQPRSPARAPRIRRQRTRAGEGAVDPLLQNRFQQIISLLMYLIIGTHPDIAFAVIKLAQMTAHPTEEHVNKTLYIMRYLVAVCYLAVFCRVIS
jgi:hypothetical protein